MVVLLLIFNHFFFTNIYNCKKYNHRYNLLREFLFVLTGTSVVIYLLEIGFFFNIVPFYPTYYFFIIQIKGNNDVLKECFLAYTRNIMTIIA